MCHPICNGRQQVAPKQRTALCLARLQGPSALVLAQAATPRRGAQVPSGPHRDPVLIILWQSGSARHCLTKVAPRQRVMAPCWIRQSPGSPGPNFSPSHGQKHRHHLQRARSPSLSCSTQVPQAAHRAPHPLAVAGTLVVGRSGALRSARRNGLSASPGAQAPRS